MTFELDTLIAIAFIAPVAFFAIVNIVLFRTRGYAMAVRPAVMHPPVVAGARPVTRKAANDGDYSEAA